MRDIVRRVLGICGVKAHFARGGRSSSASARARGVDDEEPPEMEGVIGESSRCWTRRGGRIISAIYIAVPTAPKPTE